jgi:hypothetical protein
VLVRNARTGAGRTGVVLVGRAITERADLIGGADGFATPH